MSSTLDQPAVELSKRLSAALDTGHIHEALELMAQLRPIYLAAWNEALDGEARSDEDTGPAGRAAQCGQQVSVSDLMMRELEDYRAGGFD